MYFEASKLSNFLNTNMFGIKEKEENIIKRFFQ